MECYLELPLRTIRREITSVLPRGEPRREPRDARVAGVGAGAGRRSRRRSRRAGGRGRARRPGQHRLQRRGLWKREVFVNRYDIFLYQNRSTA